MRKVAHIKLSSEEAEAMIDFAGKDGKVTFEEFLKVVELAQNPGTNGTFSEGNGNNGENGFTTGGNADGGQTHGGGNIAVHGEIEEDAHEDDDD